MKRLIAWLILYVVLVVTAAAQLHDAQWVLGPPASVLDFRNDTLTTRLLPTDIYFFLTSACISSETGDLLFSCNGGEIFDRNGDSLLNGQNLSPCLYSSEVTDGFAICQGALFLPMPGNSRFYYLFHFSYDTLEDTRPGTIYYSIIDKQGNFGFGEVVQKNVAILRNVILRGGGLTACKHANGRDYWIVMGASEDALYYKFLLTPNGVSAPYPQRIGPAFPLPFDNAYCKFSPDGTKYVTGVLAGGPGIVLMDFDRCNGEFSNAVDIYNNASYDPINNPASGCTALEFSTNSRYLYLANNETINQHDLWSNNIQDSLELYRTNTSELTQIGLLQLAPNGKLYCSAWNGGYYYYHVINEPDSSGTSCNFIYEGLLTLSANSFNLPNMINYKLGPLAGSGCDTITTYIGKQTLHDRQQPRVQPNPANKYFYAEMPAQGNYIFELQNEAGQLIERKETLQVDIFNTENLPAGVYHLTVVAKNSAERYNAQKIVVQH